jgi:transcriptional regulator with XRE-family HTH domain
MFYDVFAKLCEKHGVKPSKAAEECGINKSNVSSWKNNGYVPRGDALNKIANYFNVSIDCLLGNSKEKAPTLTRKDERDIKVKMDDILNMMATQKGLMFDGDPLSPEALESIKNAMILGMTAAKLKNKEKYGHHKDKKASSNGRNETGKKFD